MGAETGSLGNAVFTSASSTPLPPLSTHSGLLASAVCCHSVRASGEWPALGPEFVVQK